MFVKATDSRADKHAALLVYCTMRDAHGADASHVVGARNALLQANLDLLYAAARRYHCRSFDLDDLVAYGALGLIRAIERFDPGRGCALVTVAGWWIRAEIGRAVVELDTVVRLPAHVHYERDEDTRERARRMRAVASLDELVGDGGDTWCDLLADNHALDPESAFLERETEAQLSGSVAAGSRWGTLRRRRDLARASRQC